MNKILLILVIILLISGCTPKTEKTTEEAQPEEKIGPSAGQEKPQEIPIQEQEENPSETFNPSASGSPNPKIKQQIPPCCSHPYWHKIYRAFSNDGVTWQKENMLIKDQASVPAILQKDDGSFILYYVDGNIDTVGCSISKDGKSFMPGDCTIYGFTEERAWDPYIVKIENGFYRMYFFTPSMTSKENKIMSAISKDGINWLQEEGVRFQYHDILDPAVIKMGNVWRMYTWYSKDNMPGNSFIVVAKSNDGLNFEKETEFNIGGGVPEVVKLDSGNYAIFFCGMGIEYASSTDGITWKKSGVAIKTEPKKIVCDPSVIKTKENWVMYYKVQG